VIVRHPDAQVMVVLNPAEDYPVDDVLVKAFPWAFAPRDTRPGVVESVVIEQASAAPGEKRSRRSAQ
jgi:hypothetical protein